MFDTLRKFLGQATKSQRQADRSPRLRNIIRGTFEKLEERQVLAYQSIGTYIVPVQNGNWNTATSGSSPIFLEDGAEYQVKASGFAQMATGPQRLADAEYYQVRNTNGTIGPWEDMSLAPGATHNLGVRLKAANATDQFFARWHDSYLPTMDHTYTRTIIGTGANLQTKFVDSNYADNANNQSDKLKVEVFGKISGDLDLVAPALDDLIEDTIGASMVVNQLGSIKLSSLRTFGAAGGFSIDFDSSKVQLFHDAERTQEYEPGTIFNSTADKTFYTLAIDIGYTEFDLSWVPTTTGSGESLDLAKLTIIAATVDIDGDSNRDGLIDLDNNGTDDPIENDTPGVFVIYNNDDDDNNGTPDRNQFSFVNGEDDLVEVLLSHNIPAQTALAHEIVVSVNNQKIKLFTNANKTGYIDLVLNPEKRWQINGNEPVPTSLWIDGSFVGTSVIKVELYREGGAIIASDEVLVSVVELGVDLDIDSDNTGVIDRNEIEDGLEKYNDFGKYLTIYSGDIDADGQFDNKDTDGITGLRFAPIEIELNQNLSQLGNSANISIKFIYNESPLGDDTPLGRYRIWKKDAHEFKVIGDLIEANKSYTAAELGITPGQRKTFYIEATTNSLAAAFDPVNVEVTVEGDVWNGKLKDVVHVRPIEAWLDLDIDSDNDDAFGESERDSWEEKLEDNPYGLGKLVLQSSVLAGQTANSLAASFTKMTIDLPIGLDPQSQTLKIKISEYIDLGRNGQARLWRVDNLNLNRVDDLIENGGDIVSLDELYTLGQLNYDANVGRIDLYIDGFDSSINLTLHDVETNGRGNDGYRAHMVLIENGQEIETASDLVKFIVVKNDGAFYRELQFRAEVRMDLASKGSYSFADLPDLSLKRLTMNELEALQLDPVARQLLYADVNPNLVPGFAAVLYQDYTASSDGQYILAYAGTDDLDDLMDDIWQGLGWQSPQYDAAMELSDLIRQAIPIANVTATGHSLGGGLASAAAVVTGMNSYTFNSAGLHENTLVKTVNGVTTEKYVGSLNRYNNANNLIQAYYVDWDLLSDVQDEGLSPLIPAALGSRIEMDGPYDSEMFWDYAAFYGSFVAGQPWGAVAAELASYVIMGYAHMNDAVLHGLLVDESAGTDYLGYNL